MFRRFVFLFLIIISLNSCVETVVVGTVVGSAIVLSDGTIFDLSQDSRIESSVRKILKKSENKNKYKHINVDVFNGKILLTGYVESADLKSKVVSNANSISNEAVVIDEIMVFNQNYKYRVVDGIVFVIGKAENRNELNKVLDVMSRVKGVREVVDYVIVSTSGEVE